MWDVHAMPQANPDLIALHTIAVALARSMRAEPDARRFVENLSPYLREFIPHDRLLLIPGGNRRGPSVPDVERTDLASCLTIPFEGLVRGAARRERDRATQRRLERARPILSGRSRGARA